MIAHQSRTWPALGWAPLAAMLVAGASLTACARSREARRDGASAAPAPATLDAKLNDNSYEKPSDAELKEKLSNIQYQVTQNNGTEPPFRNRYWNNKRAGLYVDVTSGEPLFSSNDKFASGTGWPSFTRPIEPARVVSKTDSTHGMARVEVRSHSGDAHLGHVFDDGPQPTGLRYCINSASMRFIPADKLDAEGYGQYKKLFEKTPQ